MVELTQRQLAKLTGNPVYCGRPCINCSGELRYTRTSACVPCDNARKARYYAANRTSVLSRVSAYREANKEKIAVYRASRADKTAECRREWRAANLERERERERIKARKRRQEQRGAKCAERARERAARLLRTVTWADLAAIRAFYEACPKGWHVDHIIPLRGRTASGLHTLDNLQYLPARDNLSKGNRLAA